MPRKKSRIIRKFKVKVAPQMSFEMVRIRFQIAPGGWRAKFQCFAGKGKKKLLMKEWQLKRPFNEKTSNAMIAALKELALTGAQPKLREYMAKKGMR